YARQRYFERRPPGGVGTAREPITDIGVSRPFGEQIGHARQRRGVDMARNDRLLRGNAESVEVAMLFHWTMRCPFPPPGRVRHDRPAIPIGPAGRGKMTALER